jgi:hypothetical protein
MGTPSPGMLPAEYPRHRPVPSTLFPSRVWSYPPRVPFFCRGETAIGKAFIPTNLFLILQLSEKRPPDLKERSILFPLLEPSPARAWAAVFFRQFTPRRSRPESQKNSFKTFSCFHPRSPSFRVRSWRWKMNLNLSPLSICEMSPTHASHPRTENGVIRYLRF